MKKLIKGAIKAAIVGKVIQIVQREARKPENIRRVKQQWKRMQNRSKKF